MNIQSNINQLLTMTGAAAGFKENIDNQRIQTMKQGITAAESNLNLEDKLKDLDLKINYERNQQNQIQKQANDLSKKKQAYQTKYPDPTKGQKSYITKLSKAEESFKNKISEQASVIQNKELAKSLAQKRYDINQSIIDKTKIMKQLGGK